MLEVLEMNPLVLGAIAVAILVALWLVLQAMRRPAARSYRPDVLDDGVAPAARNQALIDAAPSTAQMAGAEPSRELVEKASGDDLSRIKGLGPKLQALLPTLGVTSFAQIAAWSDDDLAGIDAQLGAFAGRPVRDNWIEQAQLLAAGDVAGFEDKFGKV